MEFPLHPMVRWPRLCVSFNSYLNVALGTNHMVFPSLSAPGTSVPWRSDTNSPVNSVNGQFSDNLTPPR